MRLLGLLILLLTSFMAYAQDEAPLVVRVLADSIYTRTAPDAEASHAASIFKDNNLHAIGRNIDGTWIEVQRPGLMTRLGWVQRDYLALMFDPGLLPITDLTTGVSGETPVIDTGFSILTGGEAQLRASPDRNAESLGIVPVNVVLPVIERTPNQQWLKVNYRGTVGWVIEFIAVTTGNLERVPVAQETTSNPLLADLPEVPLETQIAQVDRLIGWIIPLEATAENVSLYWRRMFQGETLECLPPAGNYAYFSMTPQDLAELPELRRQQRQLTLAIDELNKSIETMKRCGIYLPREMNVAYNDAIAAKGIFKAVRQRMEVLREKLIEQHQ